jgi:outer membrane protein TolC
MKIISFVLAFVLAAGVAQAADLAELQEQALANREVIQRYIIDLEISRKNEVRARSGFYPSLDLAYKANWLDEASAFENRENKVASGAVSWNLFAGFRDKYSTKSAEFLRRAESRRLQGIKQNIKLAVALRYLAVFDRQANLQVAEDSENNLKKLHEDAVNRFEVGLINKSDKLKFKVDLDDAVIAKKKARADLDKSVALLEREIGGQVDSEQLDFKEFKEMPVLKERVEYEKHMLNKRSEIKFLEETIGAAAMKVKVERASFYPSVDLASVYNKYDNSIDGFGIDDEEIRTQVTLSMNIFDGFDKKSRMASATLEEQGLKYDLMELKRDLLTRLRNIFLDYHVSADNVQVAAGSIEQAEENLRVNRLNYEEGVSPESELLDAIANLSRAKFNFVAAKSEGFARYFQIIRAVEEL